MAVEIFLDCGAPSIYNELSRLDKDAGKRRKEEGKKAKTKTVSVHMRKWHLDDFSYVELPEYKAYRRRFLQFIKANLPYISAFPNLDVIHNAELTYKNQMWFERRGVRPLPVWHLGSDVAWLERYLSEGYDYICIGGLVPNTIANLRPALDRLWEQHLTADDGMPLVKIHGFGMTSFDLMYRYPWYSVDSKSWSDYARFGFILVPPKDLRGQYDWLHPAKITVSNRCIDKRQVKTNFRCMPRSTRRLVIEYLEHIDIPLGKSRCRKVKPGYKLKDDEQWLVKPDTEDQPGEVEKVLEVGVTTHFTQRMGANLILFKEIEKAVPEWPWAFKPKPHRKGLLE